MVTITELPDTLLLEVFSYLPVRDRIRIARVCHRWKRIADDRWLWRHVDLTIYKMCPKVLWHLLRRYLASRLQSLRMGGYLFSGSNAPQLSPTLLRALGLKCPNLTRLCLQVADLRALPLACLPPSLRTLELHSCEISSAWLYPGPGASRTATPLPHLERLVLHRVPTFCDEHLLGLGRFPALRTLVMGGTYHVTETGLSNGLRRLSQLQHLEVLDCTLAADVVLRAVRHCRPNLQGLSLSARHLSVTGLEHLPSLVGLQSLSLMGPPVMHNLPSPLELLAACQALPMLRSLEIRGLGWEGQEAEGILSQGLPQCWVSVRAYTRESRDWWM
ncbi:F-box/LRR-repeat protein 12-like [Erinaceus europaeus]|uniref:F-box/LRR-repeat protein 12-like n=1 Tax=Erinaceus europaeus TaxID=9365 RepID=A0A1S3A192_ERIEU|nr:F-box/LRR-repeat protein 12-like [Erinaceus europaeus]